MNIQDFSLEQRQEMAEALRQAKQHLWNGSGERPEEKSHWICRALSMVDRHSPAVIQCKALIMYRLEGCHTVLSWLVQKNHIPDGTFTKKTLQHIQEYRHLWVDHLIQELETA